MAITDLLSSVSKPRAGAARSAFAPPGPDRRSGRPDRRTEPRDHKQRRLGADRRATPRGPVDIVADAVLPPDRAPLPSHAILVIGGLTLVCIALAGVLLMTLGGEPAEAPADLAVPVETVADAPAPAAPAASFDAEPAAIPTALLTRLEAASDGPLEQELALLLEAIQTGFGTSSVQLEPTLRAYAYRMASRFVWNPDTFQVDVRAPDEALASARAATLVRLFEAAVDDGRLDVRPGVGPHSLTLASR